MRNTMATLLKAVAPLLLLLTRATAGVSQSTPTLGVEFGGGPFVFTNIASGLRRWVLLKNTSANAPVDLNGWPLADVSTVVFDNRAFPAWSPPLDDPWGWQAPCNGTYLFNFTGQATLGLGNDPGEKGVTLGAVTFDPVTWTTAGTFTLAPGAPNLVEMTWADTRATHTSANNTGFTNLRIMTPGTTYTPGPAVLDPHLLAGLGIGAGLSNPLFHHIRYMGATGTNTQPGYYGDEGHHALTWNDRCLPSDALQPMDLRPGCWGMPWESVVRVTQATGLGAWINLPVSASVSFPVNSSDYAFNLAQLFKAGNAATGNAGVGAAPVYLEHSNEVWVSVQTAS